MTASIPRALVAAALGVDEEALPEGDLPLERLALRFLAYLRAGDGETVPEGHPDAWTFAVFDELTRDHPVLALATIRTALAACKTREDVAALAAGPLEDLIAANGAALIDEIETLASRSRRFAYALTGVWPQGKAGGLLWARVDAARAGVPGLDDGAPLPPPDDP